jgi:benzil reductase ((S)-benzoin forming)
MNHLFITGTGKGIGKALAMCALQNQANIVYGLSRQNEIDHPSYTFSPIDLANEEEVLAFSFKPITSGNKVVLINNAGILGEIDRVGQTSDSHYQQVYQVNLVAPSILINKFIKQYQNFSGEKIIINISSGASTAPYESWAAYCASKAGLEMFTKVLVKELPNEFKIYSIAPGVVDTNMQTTIRATEKSKFIHLDKFLDLKMNGALYTPQAVADKILEVIEKPHLFPESVFRIVL